MYWHSDTSFHTKLSLDVRAQVIFLLKVKSRNKSFQDPNLVKYFVVLVFDRLGGRKLANFRCDKLTIRREKMLFEFPSLFKDFVWTNPKAAEL